MRNSATATSKVALIDVGQTCVQGLYLSYTCIYVYMSRRKSMGGYVGPAPPPPLWLVKSMISSWVSLNYKRSFNWKHKRYQSYTCWIYFNVINYDKYCRYSFIHSANLYIYLSRWNYYYSLHVFFMSIFCFIYWYTYLYKWARINKFISVSMIYVCIYMFVCIYLYDIYFYW